MNTPLQSSKFLLVALLCAAALACSLSAQAAPVRLTCTFDRANGANAAERVWTYDAEAHTVDGHRVGEKVSTVGTAYNQYFITDTLVGFSSSSGVRHTISRADGRYTAFGISGKVIWTGSCVVAQ